MINIKHQIMKTVWQRIFMKSYYVYHNGKSHIVTDKTYLAICQEIDGKPWSIVKNNIVTPNFHKSSCEVLTQVIGNDKR